MLNLLFLGNSYTFYNDLDRVTAEVFEAAAESESVQAVRLAEGGYTFPMHLAQADGTNGDPSSSPAPPPPAYTPLPPCPGRLAVRTAVLHVPGGVHSPRAGGGALPPDP